MNISMALVGGFPSLNKGPNAKGQRRVWTNLQSGGFGNRKTPARHGPRLLPFFLHAHSDCLGHMHSPDLGLTNRFNTHIWTGVLLGGRGRWAVCCCRIRPGAFERPRWRSAGVLRRRARVSVTSTLSIQKAQARNGSTAATAGGRSHGIEWAVPIGIGLASGLAD